jgi:hypothetical protein
MVDFGLKDSDEASFAEFLVVLRPDYQGSRNLANGT